MAAQRIARGSGHDANWDLILTEEGSDRNGWLHTTGVFRPAPEERLTRPVPLGYVEMEFSREGKALPDIPAGADRQRTTVALARSTGGRHRTNSAPHPLTVRVLRGHGPAGNDSNRQPTWAGTSPP